MPDAKPNVPKVAAPSPNVGKVYGTYVTETEKKAAAANDWLLPKDKAAEAARSTASSVKSPVAKLAAPAAPAANAVKAGTSAVSNATSAVSEKAAAATGNITGKASELTGNLTNKLQLPQVPNFPALDKGGIMLGAGPKFVANTVTKFSSIVPPFVPGLVMNVGMIAGAISVVKSMGSINPSQLLSQLTSNIAGDLKDQAGGLLKSATDAAGGLGDIKNQVAGLESAASGIVDSAKSAAGGIESAVSDVASNVNLPSANLPNISVSDIKGNVVASVTKPVNDAVSGTVSKIIPPIG